MACDVVISEIGRLTIICDAEYDIPDTVRLRHGHLSLMRDGEYIHHLGQLTPALNEHAVKCNFAMFVSMDGYSVISATEIGLQID